MKKSSAGTANFAGIRRRVVQSDMKDLVHISKHPCKKCGSSKNIHEEVTFSNGTKHIQVRCCDCGNKKGFAPQVLDNPGAFRMPIGKHSGKMLSEIKESDPDYLVWAADNLKENIQRRIKEFLKI